MRIMKSKRVLENFKINQDFYYWYKSKKEAQIITKTKSREEALKYIISKFNKIKNPNDKFIYDVAIFIETHKNMKKQLNIIL